MSIFTARAHQLVAQLLVIVARGHRAADDLAIQNQYGNWSGAQLNDWESAHRLAVDLANELGVKP